MKFTLNRNKTVASILGHAVEFKKGVPTFVPQALWPEVQAIGAMPEEDIPDEPAADSKEPADALARKQKIFEGFEKIVFKAERESFSGTGVPHVRSLIDVIGFAIDGKERDTLWQEFKLLEKAE
jgi:hypothetical protein